MPAERAAHPIMLGLPPSCYERHCASGAHEGPGTLHMLEPNACIGHGQSTRQGRPAPILVL
eukprot:5972926-Amphidinium_carterae.4